jgi:hypothetical protein
LPRVHLPRLLKQDDAPDGMATRPHGAALVAVSHDGAQRVRVRVLAQDVIVYSFPFPLFPLPRLQPVVLKLHNSKSFGAISNFRGKMQKLNMALP